MRDVEAHLEKLSIQVTECERIRVLATDPQKKKLFARLAEHHKILAAEIELVIADKSGIADTFMGRKTQAPFRKKRALRLRDGCLQIFRIPRPPGDKIWRRQIGEGCC